MHILLTAAADNEKKLDSYQLGAVAFDFENALEPHELLQRDSLCCTSTQKGRGGAIDWIFRSLGRHDKIWVRAGEQRILAEKSILCWFGEGEAERIFLVDELVWMAQHVVQSDFRVPDIRNSGLSRDNPLHASAIDASLLQSAFRALTRFRRNYGKQLAGSDKLQKTGEPNARS